MKKPAKFEADSLKRLQAMPEEVQDRLGRALGKVQHGADPPDWKVLPGMPSGCKELRAKVEAGAFRLIYIVKPEVVLVLNVFQKKSQAAPKAELDLAKHRLKLWEQSQKEKK